MTTEELAYAAGMFEGEGSVRINSRTKRNLGALLVDLGNTMPEVPAFFAERWGGTVVEHAAADRRRRYWRWRCASTQAARFLNDVLPYLRTLRYRERALLGLEYQAQKTSGARRRSVQYADEQAHYYERMKALNTRGNPLVDQRRKVADRGPQPTP